MVILHRVQSVKPRAPACCPRSPGPRRHRSPAQIKGRLLPALLRPPSAGSGSGAGGLGCLRINLPARDKPAPPPPNLFPTVAPMDVDLPNRDEVQPLAGRPACCAAPPAKGHLRNWRPSQKDPWPDPPRGKKLLQEKILLDPIPSFPTVSGTFHSLFRVLFNISHTVLLCYRSPG